MLSQQSTIEKLLSLAPRVVKLDKRFSTLIWEELKRLSESDQDLLYQVVTQLASAVFGDDMSPYWNQKRKDDFLNKVYRFQFVVLNQKEIVGWSGSHRLTLNRKHCLFMDATGIINSYQGSGVMRKVFVNDLKEYSMKIGLHKAFFVAMRTESPVIYEGLRRAVGRENIYPIMEDRSIPNFISDLGEVLSEKLNQKEKFQKESLIIKNAFNGPCPWRYDKDLNPLLGSHLHSRDEQVNRYFKEKLNPEDSFILVMKYSFLILMKYKILRAWEKKCR